MVRKALGIDIGDDFITAVVTQLKGKHYEVISAHSVPRGGEELQDQLEQLGRVIQWEGGTVYCGIPLSMMSVRTLSLPFQDQKTIMLALPQELDDQLIRPLEEQVFDYCLTEKNASGSNLLAFALQREDLLGILAPLNAQNIDPVVVMPRTVALASAVGQYHGVADTSLLLWVDISSLSLVLFSQGACVFCRRIAYPEEMAVGSPFLFRDGTIEMVDRVQGEQCIEQVCASIRRSLDFLYLQDCPIQAVERILVTGPMSEHAEITGMLHAFLAARVEKVDVADLLDMKIRSVGQEHFQPHLLQTALCLALIGLKKQRPVNFRKGDLGKAFSLFSSTRQLVSIGLAGVAILALASGYLAFDRHRLSRQDRDQKKQMQAILKRSIPHAVEMREPYKQMKIALEGLRKSDTVTPIFSNEKRNLEILADISSRIPVELELQVVRMVIDQELIMMRGVTKTYNSVNEIKSVLDRSERYEGVRIVSATADKKTKMIRFEMQLQQVGV